MKTCKTAGGAIARLERRNPSKAGLQGGLGFHIRQIRLERGLTLNAIAAAAGMSASAVSKMEKGHLSLTL